MKIICVKDPATMSLEGANLVIQQLLDKPTSILGLATGSTPIGLYQHLVAAYQAKTIDFSQVTTVNLDEYVGLSGDHPQSYRYFMNHHLFNHVNVDLAKTHVPDGMAKDVMAQAKAYEEMIDQLGGIDLQILGLGSNGHIGFNEPGDYLVGPTHLENLTASTIQDNARFFDSYQDVPKQAISMGMESIFKARKIILMASGKNKAKAVLALTRNHLDPHWPVSFLRLHPDVTVIIDEEAASLLEA